jgi:hypothetical protein
MKLTRKQFLNSMATGLAATALPSRLLKAVSRPLPPTASLESQVGTSFQLRSATGVVSQVVLNRFENKASSNGTSQFSLAFAGSSDVRLAEGTYDVQHPALGNFRMFIIPMGSGGQDANSYRADFNLLS